MVRVENVDEGRISKVHCCVNSIFDDFAFLGILFIRG